MKLLLDENLYYFAAQRQLNLAVGVRPTGIQIAIISSRQRPSKSSIADAMQKNSAWLPGVRHAGLNSSRRYAAPTSVFHFYQYLSDSA